MAILDFHLLREKLYHTGKNGSLSETGIEQLYKSMFEKDFQKLDQKIESTIYSYLEEIGFYNPRQYVFLHRYDGENKFVGGQSRDTGEMTGFVSINQPVWHASKSLIDCRSIVLHEMFHILGRHNSHQFLSHIDARHRSCHQQDLDLDLERKDLQKKQHQEVEINEVFAEIAAKDFGKYPQRRLLLSAFEHKNNKIVFEQGHLTPMERPYAIEMWKKSKKELALSTPKSIMEYFSENALALRAFSEKYVENRKENIENADNYAQAQWKLNPVFTNNEDYDYKYFFVNAPKRLHPTIENEVRSFFQQERDTLTLSPKWNIHLYGESCDEESDNAVIIIMDENAIVRIGSGWRWKTSSEKRRAVSECFKVIVAADNRRTS